MRVARGDVDGVLVFIPEPVHDDRGFFTRTFDPQVASGHGLDPARFVQDSQSRSRRGVVRGLHLRTDGGEGKLVRCAHGAVFDVAVDLRPWSPTFECLNVVRLDDVHHLSVWLPPGLAHGLQALTETADVCYRIDRAHRPDTALAIAYDDPDLAIDWPLPIAAVSDRDRTAARWCELREHAADWFPAPVATSGMP